MTTTLTPEEFQKVGEILGKIGGELVETVQGQKAVFKFQQAKGMLTLISVFKADPRLSSRIRINSKLVDGANILTIEKV